MIRGPALVLICGAGLALTGAGLWISKRFRITPEERERRRRIAVGTGGRMVDANIVDVQGVTVYYSYVVRGVEYTASQDLSTVPGILTEELGRIVGAATIKYARRNPANSIVRCEEWSGFRVQHHQEEKKQS
jgi:hypothetical protein